VREQIALTVAERNRCEYCLAAHSTIGKMVGLSEEQILDSRQAKAIDSKTEALLRFAGRLVDNRGRISDIELNELRNLGVDDSAVAEVVANVALNIFTNYFNHVSETEIDFPKVAPLSAETEPCASSGACRSAH
jgi:AhpD family alkylhydroperoxidase